MPHSKSVKSDPRKPSTGSPPWAAYPKLPTGFSYPYSYWAPDGSNGKKLSAVRQTWVQRLGQEQSLEKGRATHSSILAWEIPWTEEPGGLQSTGSQRVGHD